jgi:hypothetical protein
MTWTRRLYPVLFAIYPVLGIAAKNPGYYRVADAAVLSAIAIVGTLVVYLILYALLRLETTEESAADGAALLALVVVGVFYGYRSLRWVMEFITGNPRVGTVLLCGVAAVIVAVYLFRWYRYVHLGGLGRYLTLVGALLVGWSVAQLAYYRVSSARAIARSALVQELARPVPIRQAAASGDTAAADPAPPKRDIYVLVLDEYASSAVLREQFGIDNRPFEDSLRALGFRVPTSVHSNYANTLMSVSSLLNFAQMEPLANVVSPTSRDFGPAAYLMEHNRAERFLKSHGYRFIFFPSSWYGPTRENSDADEQFALDTTFNLGRAIQRSELTAYFLSSTLLNVAQSHFPTSQEVHTADVARTFAGLAAVSHDQRLTFALAHILMPHVPYIEDSTCTPRPRGTRLPRRADSAGRAALTEELTCLNRQILHMVRAVIAQSNPKPIIILQGDHGTQALNLFASMTTLPTVEQARERFRPFGAYYLPDGGGAVVPDSTSIVNVLRYVFSYYFDADLPPLPNTMYYSHWERPYRFTQIDDSFRTVRPAHAASTR